MIDFILKKPILSIVCSIFILAVGILCLRILPVAQYPNMVPPLIRVSASLPGASAELLSTSVAAPLERAINGVEGMTYMYSESATPGIMNLSVHFEIGSDPNLALINTQNRVNLALPSLPEEIKRTGVVVSKSSPSTLLFLAIQDKGGTYDQMFLSNYCQVYIAEALQRIKGVSSARVITGNEYSMRVWLKPDLLAQFSLAPSDIIAAIQEQNAFFSIGEIGAEPTPLTTQLTIPVSAQGRLKTKEEFENVIIRARPDGATIFLKDVATIELGSQDYGVIGLINGAPGVLIGITQDSSANALQVASSVKAKMNELQQFFPSGIEYSVPYDISLYIKFSVNEVITTLIEAALLVSFVIFIFLHNFRASLIPIISMIISIVGTFAGMYFLGYSINTLTLFGMVLAVGIVVDDTIVVVENIELNVRSLSLSSKEATAKTLHDVAAPVIAIVVALCAVFVPVASIGGIPGKFYSQFALTIVVSVIISGFVALTLSPILAEMVFRKVKEPSKFAKLFDKYFQKITDFYLVGVAWFLNKKILGSALFIAVLVSIGFLASSMPLGFVPQEDQGTIMVSVDLPDGASLNRVNSAISDVESIVNQIDGVQNFVSFSGYSLLGGGGLNHGAFFIKLKDWSERKSESLSSRSIIEELKEKTALLPEAKVSVFNPPAVPGIGIVGGFDFWLLNQAGATEQVMDQIINKVIEEGLKLPTFKMLISSIHANAMELFVHVDRIKAKALGVRISEIFTSLQALLGSVYINDFSKAGRNFSVIAQAEPTARDSIDDIGNIFVRSDSNVMVPLKSLVTTTFSSAPTRTVRFNGSPAAMISVIPNAAPDKTISTMESIAAQYMLPGMGVEWGGLAYEEKKSGGVALGVLLGSFSMLFLILAALYERWSLPITILLAVPFGIFGALFAIWMRGQAMDIYFQIGVIALIGLTAKNAILIVEFARIKRSEGLGILESVMEAAKLRFRAIIMTSLTMVFGLLPLVLSSGAGAASRHSVGTGVIGGMFFGTILALYFVPLFFLLIESFIEGKKNES